MTLYERLGGQPAIHAVVEGMYAKIFTDPDLEDFFRKTNKDHQKG
jgi:truncated hemoglobin YjbI